MDKSYKTERLVLATLDDSESAAKRVADYFRNNKEYLKPWDPLRDDDFYTAESRRQALTWELNAMKSLSYLRLWVFKKEDTELSRIIGTIGLSNIMKGSFFSCRLGYSIDKDEENKGYMTEAVKKAVYIAFDEYGLHRIEATIMPSNIPSIRIAEKLGFAKEGLLRSYQRINGEWEDHYLVALLRE